MCLLHHETDETAFMSKDNIQSFVAIILEMQNGICSNKYLRFMAIEQSNISSMEPVKISIRD
jgi:hypothetical protein